jgi:arsenate reductase
MSNEPVKIEVLVFDGCPHAEPALVMAKTIAERFEGVSVQQSEVDNEEKASVLGFLGSPSIRVNGEDVEGRTTSQGAMCCRTYEGGAGVPPEWMVEAAVLRATKPRGLLFLCVANSARSQMAEAIARSMAPEGVTIWSAGSRPTQVRPEAIAALEEIGIDVSTHRSKAVSEIPADQVDTVVTLCGEQECPLFLGKATRLHWGLPDPAAAQGDDEARLDTFRQTRDELRRRLAVVFRK